MEDKTTENDVLYVYESGERRHAWWVSTELLYSCVSWEGVTKGH